MDGFQDRQHFIEQLPVDRFAGPLNVLFHLGRIGRADDGGGDVGIGKRILNRELFDARAARPAVGRGASADLFQFRGRWMPIRRPPALSKPIPNGDALIIPTPRLFSIGTISSSAVSFNPNRQ